jgi:hypothetical protein
MTQERNLEFLWYNLVIPVYSNICWVGKAVIGLCKKKKTVQEDDDRKEDFITACISGDLGRIERIKAKFDVDLNEGLNESVQAGQVTVAEYLIKQGANNLDENLKISCANNKFAMAEMLVQNGARVIVGLRVAKSINIIKMLHRYEQNSELIN